MICKKYSVGKSVLKSVCYMTPLSLWLYPFLFIYFNFNFYFILLYNTVLVLPYIDMNVILLTVNCHSLFFFKFKASVQ